ncbi:hypothetical protein V2J09_019904 [Rumex salicifolius]
MEKGKIRRVMAAVLMIGWLATVIRESEAQATCAASLTPCADYINATHPPATCCSPLKEALATQKMCLCNIFNDPNTLKSFGINVTDALSLPTRCNITTGASSNICAAPSQSPATTNTSTASGKNAADIVAWSGVSSILAVMASLALY